MPLRRIRSRLKVAATLTPAGKAELPSAMISQPDVFKYIRSEIVGAEGKGQKTDYTALLKVHPGDRGP